MFFSRGARFIRSAGQVVARIAYEQGSVLCLGGQGR